MKYFKSKVGWWLVAAYFVWGFTLFMYSLWICNAGLKCLRFIDWALQPAGLVVQLIDHSGDSFVLVVLAAVINIIIFYNIGYLIDFFRNKKN